LAEKLELVWSPIDETPIFTLSGIFKDAPHPNTAKLYLAWFLAREQQTRLGSFSSRVDVPGRKRCGLTAKPNAFRVRFRIAS
jgi:ABC-type Fe3+ transport system substrate-binding protein